MPPISRRDSGAYGFGGEDTPSPSTAGGFSRRSSVMSITSDEFRGFGDFDEDEDPELAVDDEEDYDGFAGFGGFDEPPVTPAQSNQRANRNARESPATVKPTVGSTHAHGSATKMGTAPKKAGGRTSPGPKVHPAMAPLVSPASTNAPVAKKKPSGGGMAELLRRESEAANMIELEHQNRMNAERERQAAISKRGSDPRINGGSKAPEKEPAPRASSPMRGFAEPVEPIKPIPSKLAIVESVRPGFRRTQSTRPAVTPGGETPMNRRFQANRDNSAMSNTFGANFNLLAQTMSTLRDKPAPPKITISHAAAPAKHGGSSRAPAPAKHSGKGGPDDDDYEDLDPQALAAAKWTDGEIRKLIQVIKHEGQKGDDGKWFITFGVLFNETANIFDALSGICKTAKKYKVVAYGPEQLWQGQHDAEIIKLLKDTHDGIEIKRRKKLSVMTAPSAMMFRRTSMQTLNSECHACGKTVYPMEFVGASDKAFHKRCFRCTTCNKTLTQNDYSVGRDGAFRCAAHHKEFERTQL